MLSRTQILREIGSVMLVLISFIPSAQAARDGIKRLLPGSRQEDGRIALQRLEAPEWRWCWDHRTVNRLSTVLEFVQYCRDFMLLSIDVNAVYGDKKCTALMCASYLGNAEVVRKLLKYGAVTDAQDADGWTALMHEVYVGDVEAVKILLECGVVIDTQDKGGCVALMIAFERGKLKVVKELLERVHTLAHRIS